MTVRLQLDQELRRIVGLAEETAWIASLVLVGSLAAGGGDAMSDIDLIAITSNDFDRAWRARHALHEVVLACWDERRDERPRIGAHKWLTNDMILVECLIASTESGIALAEPFKVLAGSEEVAGALPRRVAVRRGEMRPAENPIERAYDELKRAMRDSRR